MQTDFTQFQNWLTCQYPHSSASKHIISDLALFSSWTGKPPSEISPQEVDRYIHHCLEKSFSPPTINRRLSSLRLFYYFLRIAAITNLTKYQWIRDVVLTSHCTNLSTPARGCSPILVYPFCACRRYLGTSMWRRPCDMQECTT